MNKECTEPITFVNGRMRGCKGGYISPSQDVEERVIEPFWARLWLVGMERGRSAANALWSETIDGDPRYVMMFTNYQEVMKLTNRGSLWGLWAVRKQGANYGLFLVRAQEAAKLRRTLVENTPCVSPDPDESLLADDSAT